MKGHKQAKEQLKTWANDPNYYERPSFLHSNIIPNINKLLNSAPRDAISIFKNLIASQYFVQGSDQFYAHEVYELFSRIIARDMGEGWRIWNELNQKDDLTTNQQLLLAGSLLCLLDIDNQAAIETAFSTIDALTFGYEQFISKFSLAHSRELVIEFIVKGAKTDFSPIASFEIAKRFTCDPDPSNENSPDDPKGEHNYHKQILDGKKPNLITSVRGRIPWAIRHIVRPGIEDKIGEVIELTRNLTEDKNLYVRLQSCVALTRLAQTRYSRTEKGNRLIPEAFAQEIENLAFQMLDNSDNKIPVIQEWMARVFNYLTLIDFERALKATDYFVHADVDALRTYLQTIIIFAELNETFSSEQRFKFTEIIFDLIDKDSRVKSQIALLMHLLSNKEDNKGENYIKNTLRYIKKIVEKYDENSFERIYSLVKDNLNKVGYQKDLISIYKTCIAKEYEYLSTHPKYPNKTWAPYYWNGDILEMIFSLSKQEFIDIFKMLVNYPLKCNIGNIEKVVDLLSKTPQSMWKEVEHILNCLVKRDSTYYDKKKQWEDQITRDGVIP